MVLATLRLLLVLTQGQLLQLEILLQPQLLMAVLELRKIFCIAAPENPSGICSRRSCICVASAPVDWISIAPLADPSAATAKLVLTLTEFVCAEIAGVRSTVAVRPSDLTTGFPVSENGKASKGILAAVGST